MRMTFLNQKGGVGKTTLVLLIGGVLKRAGYDVAIDDRDPQGSARFFAERVGVPLYDEDHPSAYIATDTPGHFRVEGEHERAIAALIAESDKLLLVSEKSPAAVHGSVPMAKLIKSKKRQNASAHILFNRVRSRTAVGQQEGRVVAADLGLPALQNELPLAAAYENAFIEGLTAVRGNRRNELLNLALEVMK